MSKYADKLLDGLNDVDFEERIKKDEINLIDKSGVSGGGREFYGENLTSVNKSLSISFPTSNVLIDTVIGLIPLILVFFIFDILISCGAVFRQRLRVDGVEPISPIGEFFDKYYLFA